MCHHLLGNSKTLDWGTAGDPSDDIAVSKLVTKTHGQSGSRKGSDQEVTPWAVGRRDSQSARYMQDVTARCNLLITNMASGQIRRDEPGPGTSTSLTWRGPKESAYFEDIGTDAASRYTEDGPMLNASGWASVLFSGIRRIKEHEHKDMDDAYDSKTKMEGKDVWIMCLVGTKNGGDVPLKEMTGYAVEIVPLCETESAEGIGTKNTLQANLVSRTLLTRRVTDMVVEKKKDAVAVRTDQ
ncbi:hypothetical protein ARMGADRAFT_1038736 [Armillaria gallica]|uniref:Uncharacterized protein n=1 Tax=Armillaria gallica TaxID=47427 RepID=A0A2H3CGW3_ARMGA|nr:hypothetical protein ARMGADRAFT_1038736 [Armillaria gallica]